MRGGTKELNLVAPKAAKLVEKMVVWTVAPKAAELGN